MIYLEISVLGNGFPVFDIIDTKGQLLKLNKDWLKSEICFSFHSDSFEKNFVKNQNIFLMMNLVVQKYWCTKILTKAQSYEIFK